MSTYDHAAIQTRPPNEPRMSQALVIQDDPGWQFIINRALQKIDARIQVIFHCNVEQALRALDDNPHFDLIICDYSLRGEQTGLDVWDKLLARSCYIPYVLLSGENRRDFLRRKTFYHADSLPDVVEKTASIQELSEAFAQAYLQNPGPQKRAYTDPILTLEEEFRLKYPERITLKKLGLSIFRELFFPKPRKKRHRHY